MNQILSTENNYKKKQPKSGEPLDMRKIIIIFSIIIIVFALVIAGVKIYGMIKEKSGEKNNPIAVLNKPTINIEKTENACILTIEYDEGLDKVKYWWNEENIIEKNMNGSTTPFITTIEIPEGDYNTLNVTATGIDGSINELKQEFIVEGPIEAPNKPTIDWYYNEATAQIDIIVRSQKGIKNLTYKWENEEEVVINSTRENQKELKTTIDAKRGTNGIYITATDSSGKMQSKEVTIQGIRSPDIRVELIDNKTLKISVSHDMGFKKIVINVNGQELVYDENNPAYSIETKKINTQVDVPPGTLTVEIKVHTLEQEDKEYVFKDSAEIPA